MTKSELLALAEFDEEFINESKVWLTHRDRNVATDAAYAQHARIMPLIQALVEDREELRRTIVKMCRRYDDAVGRFSGASLLSKGMTIGVRNVFEKALAASDARLAGVKG